MYGLWSTFLIGIFGGILNTLSCNKLWNQTLPTQGVFDHLPKSFTICLRAKHVNKINSEHVTVNDLFPRHGISACQMSTHMEN